MLTHALSSITKCSPIQKKNPSNNFKTVALMLYDFLRHHKFLGSTPLLRFQCLRILKTFLHISFNIREII